MDFTVIFSKCIKILQGASVAKLGDEIIVAVQKAAPNKKIKKAKLENL